IDSITISRYFDAFVFMLPPPCLFLLKCLFLIYHKTMNKSISFQSISGVVFFCILPRLFPAFLTVWDGQAERETAFLDVKLHAARFRVCVGLLADRRITAAVWKQTLFQGGVVGADMDKGVFLVKPNIGGLFLLGKPCSHASSFLRPCYAIGAFFGCFLRLLTWRKQRF